MEEFYSQIISLKMSQVSAGNLEYTIKPCLHNNSGRDSYPSQSAYSPVWGKAHSHVVLYGGEHEGLKINKMSCSAKVSSAIIDKLAREKRMDGGHSSTTTVDGSFSVKDTAFKFNLEHARSHIHDSAGQEIKFSSQLIEGIEKCVAQVDGATIDDVKFDDCKATIVKITLYNRPGGSGASVSAVSASVSVAEPVVVPEPEPDIVDVPSIFENDPNDPNW